MRNLFKRNFWVLVIFVLTLNFMFFACGGGGSSGSGDGTYKIDIAMEDNQDNDLVDVTPKTGNDGDVITINYTVADIDIHNLLYFSGVGETIEPVDKAENGTRTYTVNPIDAINGVITITARFTHTDLMPDPIEFTKNSENKMYGDSLFTNTIKPDYKGTGAITYTSSDETVATVDVNTGEVTILKIGSTTITATKAADVVYAEAKASYTLTIAKGSINITVSKSAIILTPLESDSPAYSELSDTFEVSATALSDSDKITLNITGYGLSVSGNIADIGNNDSRTITLIYDGTTSVTQTIPVNIELSSGDINNYILPNNPIITVDIFDGQTEERPIPVKNANIKAFNSYANTTDGLTRHYKLTEDITLQPNVVPGESNWTAIGNNSTNNDSSRFTGSFDGDNKKITGLTINNPSGDYQGMFGYIRGTNVMVKNLGLEEDNIIGNYHVGGVVGVMEYGTVQNCYSTGDVAGDSAVGGVVGNSTGSSVVVQNCYATGNVTGNNYVGGIVGWVGYDSTVQNCVALSTTITRKDSSSDTDFGRVVGYRDGIYVTLSNNYAYSSMQATGGFTFAGTNALDDLGGADFPGWESVVGWATFHSSKAAATVAIEFDPNACPWWFTDSGNPKLWFED